MQEPQNPQDWIYTFFNSGMNCWNKVKDDTDTHADEFIWNYVDRCIELYKDDSRSDDLIKNL